MFSSSERARATGWDPSSDQQPEHEHAIEQCEHIEWLYGSQHRQTSYEKWSDRVVFLLCFYSCDSIVFVLLLIIVLIFLLTC
jgi:hypothetical protein